MQRHFPAIRRAAGRPQNTKHNKFSRERQQRRTAASREDFVKLTSWVLGAVLTAAPIMYAQTQDQQQPTNPPASTADQSSSPSSSQPGQSSMPQSDQAPAAQVA